MARNNNERRQLELLERPLNTQQFLTALVPDRLRYVMINCLLRTVRLGFSIKASIWLLLLLFCYALV